MIVFYSDEINSEEIQLKGDEFRHCVKVLRKRVGDDIKVFSSDGVLFDTTIKSIDKLSLTARIISKQLPSSKNYHFCLAISPTKKADRTEWMLAKAVEIGVQEIWLIQTKRTEKPKYKMDRLHKIAFSAAKQSLNYKLPLIVEYPSLLSALKDMGDFKHKYIAHCLDPKEHLLHKPVTINSKSIILVGPEGDFTPEEIAQTFAYDFQEVSLGKSRLRTETAGIVALTLLNAKTI